MLARKIEGKIAIIAGKGSLPQILIDKFIKDKMEFIVFKLKSENYDINYDNFNPITLEYGEIAKLLEILKVNKVKNIILAGSVTKPKFSELKVDTTGAVLLAKILANKFLGDDAVLRAVIDFFAKHGFNVLKITDILTDIVQEKGILTIVKPINEDLFNINLAEKSIKIMSKFDIGQSVIIAQRQIIGVEAVEGTDNLIKRCKDLPINYKNEAILVKTKKKMQSKKADLPTIGEETIKNCYESGIKGIAFEAKYTLILNKEKVIDLANKHGIFLIAI